MQPTIAICRRDHEVQRRGFQVGKREADRFLDQDVTAGVEGIDSTIGVVLVAVEDCDDVERLLFQHLAVIGVYLRDPKTLPDSCAQRSRDIAPRNHLDVAYVLLENRQVNDLCHRPEPDEPHA